MTIRPIGDDDIPSVVEMMLRNWDGVLARYHSPEIVQKFRGEVTPGWLKRQMGWKQVFVAEEPGEIIATGALADFGRPGSPKPSVSQFYVRPDLHGQGIGRTLMGHLLRVAREQGCPELHVPSSRNAVPFYAAAGFNVDAGQPDTADEITWMTLDMIAVGERPQGGRTEDGPHGGAGDGAPG